MSWIIIFLRLLGLSMVRPGGETHKDRHLDFCWTTISTNTNIHPSVNWTRRPLVFRRLHDTRNDYNVCYLIYILAKNKNTYVLSFFPQRFEPFPPIDLRFWSGSCSFTLYLVAPIRWQYSVLVHNLDCERSYCNKLANII